MFPIGTSFSLTCRFFTSSLECHETMCPRTNITRMQCCGTVTIYYGSGSGSDF